MCIRDRSYSNSYISITIFKPHLTPSYLRTSTMLQGFRQYIHYHICASKTYLHGRIRKRLNNMLKLLNEAKYETEIKKSYRSLKEDNVTVVFQEEEKIEDVMKKRA
eukprot:TRINITY_DN0_c3118_g1_i1.p1 TRINITY_DN0_c3118_g1~~TRINITY_DN0_c3118_g1_i1.p1  ORF type:complete len:106 (+),score=29.07 TRINITY_DN0_c3118_g1_i1:1-318(+)